MMERQRDGRETERGWEDVEMMERQRDDGETEMTVRQRRDRGDGETER